MNSSPRTDLVVPVAPRVETAPVADLLKGTLLGIVSAVAYTAANVALRDLSETKGVAWANLVSAVKAVPCFVVAWGMVWFRWRRGLQSLPRPGRRLPLFLAALLMQFGGNVMFSWALSLVGLVLTVPLTFASLLCGSALLGQVYLNEPIQRRTLASIVLLVVSITCLSLAAGEALPTTDLSTILWGLGFALISGFSFGVNSVVIRRFVGGDHSVSSVIAVMSATGVFCLGALVPLTIPAATLLAIPASDWRSMFWAGFFNAIAFFAVCSAMRYIPAVRANLLNASQTAMCAVAGVLLFEERLTPLLVFGIVLTMAGLGILGIRRRTPA